MAVLGAEHDMRLRVGQYLVACALMAAHWAFVLGITRHEGFASGPVTVWLGLTLAVYVAFYVLLRSGCSAHWPDPSLTQAQVLASLAITAASYPFLGSVRGLIPGAMVVILSFGMFRLSKGLVWRSAGLGWLLLAGVVVANPWQLESQRWHDAVVLAAAAVVFGATGFLADQLTRIRARLSQQREQLNEALARIEALANRDALTGLFNRRFADEVLQQAVQRQRRQPGTPLCLALVDLDHFKRVNDQHGHAVGDAVLCAFAGVGLRTLRGTDTLARWGGEEFLLILQGSDLLAAEQALARLRDAVAGSALPVAGGTLRYSFSAGLTAWRPGDAMQHLLDRADRALYQAKAEGRDRVVVL